MDWNTLASDGLDWKASVYSDGSPHFVSPAVPTLGQEVTLGLQVLASAPLRTVTLRVMRNGSEHHIPLARTGIRGPLALWEARLPMNQAEVRYQFYLAADDGLWFYTQAGLDDLPPGEERDFVLKADWNPAPWVRRSVFYQIFPDRFCNGDDSLTVRDGEYSFDGHPTVRMAWDQPPKEYSEVFCLDFYGGDLPGIEARIDYLRDLGVTALYLNPIFRSATSHRYDCLDYFHVDDHLGGDEALARLSAALHRAGIRLMVDVSINHTGTAHRWFNKEGTFFPTTEGAYHNPGAPERGYYFFGPGNQYHPWAGVETLPTLNYTNPELRDILYRRPDSVVQKWLRPPYSIDAWRFDVANDMAKKDEVDLSHEVWREIRQTMAATAPEAYLLAEHWTDSSAYLQGGEWDSAMNYYGSARPLRRFLGLPELFLQKFPGSNQALAPLSAPALARWITGHLSRLPWVHQAAQFNLLGSHDTDRVHNHPSVTPGRYAVAAVLLFTLPGAPNIYYGDEVGLDGRLDSNEGFRYPMEWDPTRWKPSFVHLYRTLARLKGESKALHDGGFRILYAEGRTIAWLRFTPDEAVLAVASMEGRPNRIRVPLGLAGLGRGWRFDDVLDGGQARGRWVEGPAGTDAWELELAPETAFLGRGVRS